MSAVVETYHVDPEPYVYPVALAGLVICTALGTLRSAGLSWESSVMHKLTAAYFLTAALFVGAAALSTTWHHGDKAVCNLSVTFCAVFYAAAKATQVSSASLRCVCAHGQLSFSCTRTHTHTTSTVSRILRLVH
jgi:hypothetical protein